MTLSSSAQTARQQLAQHYVNKLRQANAAFQRGYGNRSHWGIEQDWGQITHWQR